jgi:hypothetical protein
LLKQMTAKNGKPAPPPVIRLLAANLPDEVALTLEQLIEAQPDIKYVGRIQGQMEVLVAVAAGVDVLVLGADHVQPMPGICSHLFYEFPQLKILVIANQDAGIYWLGPRCQPLSQVPMLDMIRQAYNLDQM